MNANPKSSNRKKILWVVVPVVLGALVATNPFYEPHIPLPVGIAAWFADLAIVLILSVHPVTARLGILISGLFFAVPCFLWASSLSRGMLMCCMGFPFTIAAAPLFAPRTADFRRRLAYFFTWMGMRKIERRIRSFDIVSLFRLIISTVVFAVGLACIKTVSAVGLWLLVRWLGGGITIFAFAEMVTASHDLLTTLMGIKAPALMRSPFLSTSVAEFWAKRWNVAASELGFRPLCFTPLARHGIVLALFAAFFASAVAHMLLVYTAMGRWRISIICGAFFVVQPLLILAERGMKVRCWSTTAARVWALVALGVTSPLFVEPAIQLIAPSLSATDNVLLPTIAMLGFAVIVNVFFSMGQLVFCLRFMPPNAALKPTATAP